jgi:hypothetical protein
MLFEKRIGSNETVVVGTVMCSLKDGEKKTGLPNCQAYGNDCGCGEEIACCTAEVTPTSEWGRQVV